MGPVFSEFRAAVRIEEAYEEAFDYFENCAVLLDLVQFVQFKIREKHPSHGGVLLLVNGCFSRFLNCTNGNKSLNASHFEIWQ